MIFAPDCLKGRRYLITGARGGAGSAVSDLISECGGVPVAYPARFSGDDVTPEFMLADFDGIFHAAGVEHLGALWSIKETDIFRVLQPSVRGALSLFASVGSRRSSILKDGGSIVMMSSVAAVHGTPGMALYSASKGAIESMVRCAALELAPRRIRVNAIRAGGFHSPMHQRLADKTTPQAMDEYAAKHPLGFGHASDIANMVVYLMTDAAKWVTGGCFPIDGGFSAK